MGELLLFHVAVSKRRVWTRSLKEAVLRMPKGDCQEKLFNGDQVVGRQKPAYHQEYCSDIFGGCIQCLSPHLYDFCCRFDCMQATFFMSPCAAAVIGACCS